MAKAAEAAVVAAAARHGASCAWLLASWRCAPPRRAASGSLPRHRPAPRWLRHRAWIAAAPSSRSVHPIRLGVLSFKNQTVTRPAEIGFDGAVVRRWRAI